jgi:multidrug efflux pump subunit AcrB
MTILHEDGGAKAIRTDWRQRVKSVRMVVSEQEANNAALTTPDVALTAKSGFQGLDVGVYREKDELLPIVMRAPESERENVASINNLQIWSPAANQHIPLRQVVSAFETTFDSAPTTNSSGGGNTGIRPGHKPASRQACPSSFSAWS